MRNRAKCRSCDTIIESRHRHDYVTCKCGAISVDGGTDYFRWVYDLPENFIIIEDDDSEKGLGDE